MADKDIFRIIATDAAIIGDGGWVTGKHALSSDNKEHLYNISGTTFRAVDKTKVVLRDGTNSMTGNFDLDGNSIILDADADSKFTIPSDDVLTLELAGSEKFRWNTVGFGIDVTPTECLHIVQDTTNLTILLDASASDKLSAILMLGNPTGTNRYGEVGWGLTPSGTLGSITARRGTGASTLDMIFSTNAGAGGVEAMRLDENQNLGLGTSTPDGLFNSAVGGSGLQNFMILDTFSTTDGNRSQLQFRKGASDTEGTFAETVADSLGIIVWYGSDSSNTQSASAACISVVQDGAADASNVPASMTFDLSDGTQSAFAILKLEKDALATLGSANAATPKFKLSDGTNSASFQLDGNNDLIIVANGIVTDGGIAWDTSAKTCTLTPTEAPAAQQAYPIMIEWNAAAMIGVTETDAIAINNTVQDDSDVGIAFLTNDTQRFTLGAEIGNSGTDLDFGLFKGTGGTLAAERVWHFDDDGESSEGKFTFGADNTLVTTIELESDTTNDRIFRFREQATVTDIGKIQWKAHNSSAADFIYCEILGKIETSTADSEVGQLDFIIENPSTLLQMSISEGVTIGAPTGLFKGNGTLNVAGVYYANGTAGITMTGQAIATLTTVNGIVTAFT